MPDLRQLQVQHGTLDAEHLVSFPGATASSHPAVRGGAAGETDRTILDTDRGFFK